MLEITKHESAPGGPGEVPACPWCGDHAMVPIGYGFPKGDRGPWGGLYVGHDSPRWHCTTCLHDSGMYDPFL